MRFLCLYLLVQAVACRQALTPAKPATADQRPSIPAVTVNRGDTSLQLVNGVWFLQGQPFSGSIETRYGSGQLWVIQQVYEGKEEGLMRSYYENGRQQALRFYHLGEKDSVHRGWWPNGQLQYEYHFRNGEYEGDFKEWYPSGKILKHIFYHKGKEEWGKGWRENGKPYMSFVIRNGRLYGLVNPNLCYSLRNERGEYIKGSSGQ
ncbi:MAG: hypothetical protein IM584_08085 [Chitinophagaceae bacterium]|nr:hypothetical protein [Chitinophagaceae bacterium]MEA3427099.1 hypothetical protein [Bacteroidota bacterium]MCA6452062.1 hypothetical protein [Chitinophagaceae bacterium]MCA6456076.1 hypothetical protein [Chitinophagaceae bacterium]MCA6458154.1 hypothetical protein [Chitinophagaceae bacterium]